MYRLFQRKEVARNLICCGGDGYEEVDTFWVCDIFTVLAISLAWMRIGGNANITFVHISIPVILGALSVRIYRTYKKSEQNDDK